jgi:hypothetical protein
LLPLYKRKKTPVKQCENFHLCFFIISTYIFARITFSSLIPNRKERKILFLLLYIDKRKSKQSNEDYLNFSRKWCQRSTTGIKDSQINL